MNFHTSSEIKARLNFHLFIKPTTHTIPHLLDFTTFISWVPGGLLIHHPSFPIHLSHIDFYFTQRVPGGFLIHHPSFPVHQSHIDFNFIQRVPGGFLIHHPSFPVFVSHMNFNHSRYRCIGFREISLSIPHLSPFNSYTRITCMH